MRHGYSIVTFAYNEADSIADAISSIIKNSDDRLTKVTVIANGCTDDTAKIAEEALKICPAPYSVINLEIGDKCNAWVKYIYNYLPTADVHFFVDSDVTFTDKAFPILFDHLINSSGKNAVTGLPQTGRNLLSHIELATQHSCLFGNLYGLTNEFIRRLVEKNIRLPVGLSWIDAQITKLVNDNLEYKKDDYQHRVTFVEGVGYEFESLKLWSPHDIKLYVNRICRYKTGQLQEPYLDALPFTEWPETMDSINQEILRKGVKFSALGKLAPFRKKVIKRLRKKIISEPEIRK